MESVNNRLYELGPMACSGLVSTKHLALSILFLVIFDDTGRTSQTQHPWDQTGAGAENSPNYGCSTYYGTKTPK
jgi:hypothetical protein